MPGELLLIRLGLQHAHRRIAGRSRAADACPAMDEHRVSLVPTLEEPDKPLGIVRLRRDETLHFLDDVMKRKAQMALLIDGCDGRMLRLGRQQADDVADLVPYDQRLDGGIGADDDHERGYDS